MDASRLDQLVAKVLKEELKEDENTREQSLEQFREWILKNPDIRDCPTDDSFLLPFLRVRKYSVPMAEETLLRLLKFQHNFPSLNSNLDIDDPDINDVMSSGHMFKSPFRCSNGETVHIYIPRHLDLKKHDHVTAVRSLVLNWHTLTHNETTQVLGISVVVDYNQVSPGFFTMFPIAVLKAVTASMEKTFPTRMKKIHVVNLPPVANWFFKIIMSALSEKLQNRVLFHSSLEELHQHLDPSVLPKEYGGTMPMDEMIGLWKKELAVHREAIRAINNAKLVGDSFKNDLESNETGIPDIPGSFRTLGVD